MINDNAQKVHLRCEHTYAAHKRERKKKKHPNANCMQTAIGRGKKYNKTKSNLEKIANILFARVWILGGGKEQGTSQIVNKIQK